MSSLSNIEKHLEEQVYPYSCKYIRKNPFQQHAKKRRRRVDNSEEKPENVNPNEVNLPKTMEADKNKGFNFMYWGIIGQTVS
jgi:hypothetical protein